MSSKRGQPHYRRHMRTHFALHGCRCRTHPLLSSPTRCRRRPSNERVMQMNRKKKPGAAPWQQRCLSWKRQAPKIGKWTRCATSCAAVSYAIVTGVSRSWRLDCERSVARGSCRGGSTDGFRPTSFSGAAPMASSATPATACRRIPQFFRAYGFRRAKMSSRFRPEVRPGGRAEDVWLFRFCLAGIEHGIAGLT